MLQYDGKVSGKIVKQLNVGSPAVICTLGQFPIYSISNKLDTITKQLTERLKLNNIGNNQIPIFF